MSYHIVFNVLITLNLVCIFSFVANTWKYAVHAIQDIESYPMHENPEVIDLLERYKIVALLFGSWIFIFDFSLLAIENQWIQNVSISKKTKSITIGIMAILTICDYQIYNIIITIITIIFGVLYYLNNVGMIKDEKTYAPLTNTKETTSGNNDV
eukprot:47491_1